MRPVTPLTSILDKQPEETPVGLDALIQEAGRMAQAAIERRYLAAILSPHSAGYATVASGPPATKP